MKKKLLSLALALALCLGLTVPAFAATEAIPCKYYQVGLFSDGLAKVCDFEEKWGFVDKTGREVVPCRYDDVGDFPRALRR